MTAIDSMTRIATAAVALLLLAGQAPLSDRADLAFVENRSRPTQCAQERNVVYTLSNPKIGRFEIEVAAPVYLPDLKADSTAPDPTDCPPPAPRADASQEPRKATLYEDDDVRIVGETLARPAGARLPQVVLGQAGRSDVDRIRWLRKHDDEFYEFLVADLAEGSWRVRPIPTEAFPNAAYGTVFFVGPVERRPAPVVEIAKLKIDPKAGALRMTFAKGGVAELKVAVADRKRVVFEATIDGLPKADVAQAFAAIASMHVWPTKADVARIGWKTESGLYNSPVMDFQSAYASEVRFDRIELSKHNTSAPDVTLRGFRAPPKPGP